MKKTLCVLFVLCCAPLSAHENLSGPADKGENPADHIRVYYGERPIEMTHTRLDSPGRAGRSVYISREPAALRIEVRSVRASLDTLPVLEHTVEVSSSKKLAEDLTVCFPVRSLDGFGKVMLPLKNGIVQAVERLDDHRIASYRCAGKSEKYSHDIALPLVLPLGDKRNAAVLTDPFFTSLFDKGWIRWTYPKEVGCEDSVERRTIVEIEGVSDMDRAMKAYYQTVLRDVPPGPEWMKDIAMIGYDYMSDDGRGWFNDIDTLVTLIPPVDRRKVALCLHGWYDVVGRYCYNTSTGRLDETWTNRIRGIPLSLADLHRRIGYAKEKGFIVLMYFADGVLSSKGLPDFDSAQVLREGGWNGPDVVGGPYHRNLANVRSANFFRQYARALFTEFGTRVDGFVWDETFYIKAGATGTRSHRGYLDRTQMRLIKELAAMLHAVAPGKAFFSSDCIGEGEFLGEYFTDIPPYALLADGCYQDSHNLPDYWSYGIFPNYRNVIWSCNWTPLTNFRHTVFGVYAYNTPVVATNGWGDNRGFSEMTVEERSRFVKLFNYRKQKRTELKGLFALPPYFDCATPKE